VFALYDAQCQVRVRLTSYLYKIYDNRANYKFSAQLSALYFRHDVIR